MWIPCEPVSDGQATPINATKQLRAFDTDEVWRYGLDRGSQAVARVVKRR